MTTAMAFLLAGILVGDAGPAVAPPEQAKSANTPDTSRSAARPEWEVVFDEDITLQEYARQMDYFKIEIAAISKKGKIEYVSRVSQQKPDHRVGNSDTEYRLRIGWKSGTLHAADRKLLGKAGINSKDKELTHYFPIDVQKQLEDAEAGYAGRKRATIRRTRFQIRPKTKGDAYEFVVVEQVPPKPNDKTSSANKSLNQRSPSPQPLAPSPQPL